MAQESPAALPSLASLQGRYAWPAGAPCSQSICVTCWSWVALRCLLTDCLAVQCIADSSSSSSPEGIWCAASPAFGCGPLHVLAWQPAPPSRVCAQVLCILPCDKTAATTHLSKHTSSKDFSRSASMGKTVYEGPTRAA